MIDFTGILEKANALGAGANYPGNMHREMMLELISAIQQLEELIGSTGGEGKDKAIISIVKLVRDSDGVIASNIIYTDNPDDTLTIQAETIEKISVSSDSELPIEVFSIAAPDGVIIYLHSRPSVFEVVLGTRSYEGAGYSGPFGNNIDPEQGSALIGIIYR